MNVLFPVPFLQMVPADSQYWLSHSAAPHFFPYLLIFRIGFPLGFQHLGIFFPQSFYGRQLLHTQAVKVFLCRLVDQDVSLMLGPELLL